MFDFGDLFTFQSVQSIQLLHFLHFFYIAFDIQFVCIILKEQICYNKYCTRAIITRGLYIFYPIFGSEKRFFKEVFSENSVLMYG